MAPEVLPDLPDDAKGKDGAKADGGAKAEKSLTDSLHQDDDYGLKSLFDSLHPAGKSKSKWYDKIAIRGYTQFRFTRTIDQETDSANPNLLGDRSVNGNAENFSIRRMRLIIFGDVSEHLGVYIQPDFANLPQGATTNTFFGQLRDTYADVYIDTTKIHRLRIGLSKVPFGFENLQSSQNRVPLDRTDPINSAVSPNERDLGVFYYWTPEDKQKLFRDLVDGGLKGSGNYGIFGIGVYDGQGGSQVEQNLNLHTVARLTWPTRLDSGQVVEASVQGYTGEYVVQGSAIRPLGRGSAITPAGTGGNTGHRDQRVGTTFVYYPQPFGFQSEWNWGEGPGLNDAQTAVETRWLQGGYAMVMCKVDTCDYGIFTPYCRWQYYKGGYRSIANAPYGTHNQWDLGVEWQIRKEMELVAEYSLVDGANLNAINQARVTSYRNFDGGVFRLQFQMNY
ncbi:Phosphate-selective porin O and P [Urbifossiella limnaea]|uniref:Phosphate-selective porin O and P n=1 Tax=Urbifossiella limnaea TaxID=2528023 RepID=A0A517XS77_9BACT|nr:Phosphate-selective porin O and P [Urbifossiella limnaea]